MKKKANKNGRKPSSVYATESLSKSLANRNVILESKDNIYRFGWTDKNRNKNNPRIINFVYIFILMMKVRLIIFPLIFFLFVGKLSGQSGITNIEPKLNGTVFSQNVIFKWNKYINEQVGGTYNLSISSDSLFSNTLSSKSNLTSRIDSFVVTTAGKYFWKVEYLESGQVIGQSISMPFSYVDIYTLPNLELFLRADTGVVLSGGGAVSRWLNLADTANSAIQSTTAQQPFVISGISELNNQKVVRLDGTDDLLQINSSVSISECFTVANWNGVTGSFPNYNGLVAGQVAFWVFAGNGTGGSQTTLQPSSLFPNYEVNGVATLEFAPLNDYKFLRASRNGGFNFINLNIGRDRGLTSRYWNGDVAEVMAFSSPLSDSLRGIVNSYLCKKYSKELSLGEDIINAYGFCDTIVRVDTNYTSFNWSNGDTTSFSTLTAGSTYRLTVTNKFGCEFTDEIDVIIPFTIPDDQFLCIGDTFVWDTELPNSDYTFSWVDGSSDSLLSITNQGDYYLAITDTNGCTLNSDTLSVVYDSSLIRYTLGKDTALCAGNSISLINDSSFISSYLWSTGSTTPAITIDTTGTYILRIDNGTCFKNDTINISVKGQAPQANFSSSDHCFGDTVQFNDLSTTQVGNTIIGWSWDFGDGNFDTLQDPKHLFDSTRSYTVNLQVENDSGCVGIINQVVEIYPIPVSNFSTLNRCELDSVEFQNLSTITSGNITDYRWDFDIPIISSDTSIKENPKYLYTSSGTRNVRLISISDQSCVDTSIQIIAINPEPQVDFSFQGTFIKDSTFFTNTSSITTGMIASYSWNLGNGQILSSVNPRILYANKAFYQVSLQVTSDSNCVGQISKQVKITDSPPEFKTIYPKEGQTVSTIKYLQWNERDSTIIYEVQVAADSNFATLELAVQVGQKNNLANPTLTTGLKYWRVLAKNGVFFDTSNIASFSVFNVSELDSLNLWLRGDTGVQVNSGSIFQWDDLSDSALILNQTMVNRQPSLLADELNHFPVVNFDNIDDQFLTPVSVMGKNFSISAVYNSKVQSQNITIVRGSNNWFFGPFLGQHRVFSGGNTGGKMVIPDRYVAHSAIIIDDTVSNYVNSNFYGLRYNSYPPLLLTIGANPIHGNIAEIVIVNGKISNEKREGLDQYLMDKYAPPVDAGPDRRVCSFPDSITLDVDYALSFNWDTGDTTATAVIDSAGKYYVTVTDVFERTSVDSVYFILDTFNYQVNIPFDDSTICKGESIELIAGRGQYTYSWNILETAPSIEVDSAFLYTVEVTNCEGNQSRDSVTVRVNLPSFDLGLDTTICHNEIIQLSPDSMFSNVNYQWSTGETSMSITADTSQLYRLGVTDIYGCSFTDSILINIDSTLFGLTLGEDTALCVGNRIGIINPNASITSYLWSTGNQNSVTFVDTAGAYKVELRSNRCKISDTVNIQIKGDAPLASFNSSNYCFTDSSTFVDASIPPIGDNLVRWSWDFGDGTNTSLQNPLKRYSTVRNYTVVLEVETDKGCIDTVQKVITVEPLPTANFNFQSIIHCAKESIFHEDSSSVRTGNIANYNWNFGDPTSAQNLTTLKDPFHTYDTLGAYVVSLSVETDKGCKDTVQKIININPTPNINYSFLGNCLSDSVRFLNQTVLANGTVLDYKWDIFRIGRQDFIGLPEENPSVKFNESGTYITQLRVRTNINGLPGCESINRDSIKVFESPIAGFILPVICEADSFQVIDNSVSIDSLISYQYVFDSLDTLFTKEAIFAGREDGVYTLEYTVVSENGCVSSVQKNVDINSKPEVDFSILNNNAGILFSVDIDNRTSGATSYIWDFGNGDSSSSFIPQYTYRDTGSYQLKLIATSALGCQDSLSQTLVALSEFLDAALINTFLTENNLGDVEVSFQIANTGFNTITDLQTVVDFNNEFEFRETFTTKIYSGDTEGFQMNSSFIPDAGRKIDFVCVRIQTVNSRIDSILTNNELCEKGFNDELRLDLFPNPVDDNLNLQYTLPDDGDVTFEVIDALGRIINKGFEIFQQEGYYTTIVRMGDLERGIYYYRFVFNGNETTGKFLKR